MSIPHTTLKQFISPIPVCLETDNLQVVWSTFCREKFNELVVVNHHHQPLGLIYLHSLIPNLVSRGETHANESQPPFLNWQEPLATVNHLKLGSLRVLPVDFTIDKLWPYLYPKLDEQINQESNIHNTKSPSLPIAVVDKEGKFLGVLDSLRVLEFITTNQYQKSQLREKSCISEPENFTQKGQIFPKYSQNKARIEHPSYLSSLIELLENCLYL